MPDRERTLERYCLTTEDYERMMLEQHGLCAICGRPPRGKRLILVVDHDHETEAVRGLLCSNCNVAIGLLDDDVEVVQLALDYLRAHEGVALAAERIAPKASPNAGTLAFIEALEANRRVIEGGRYAREPV